MADRIMAIMYMGLAVLDGAMAGKSVEGGDWVWAGVFVALMVLTTGFALLYAWRVIR